MTQITGDQLRGHLDTMILAILEVREAHGLGVLHVLHHLGPSPAHRANIDRSAQRQKLGHGQVRWTNGSTTAIKQRAPHGVAHQAHVR